MHRAENWRPACRLDSRLEPRLSDKFLRSIAIGFHQSRSFSLRNKKRMLQFQRKFLKINFES